MQMQINIIDIHGSRIVFYTIIDAIKHKLYRMELTLKMVLDANENCTIKKLGEASIGREIKNTIVEFHKMDGLEVKSCEMIDFRKENLRNARHIKEVLDEINGVPLKQNESYRFLATI